MSRMSIAFATNREAVIVELQQALSEQEVPRFNSEVEDIRRKHEEETSNPKVGPALADHKKRARYEDARVRREQFVNSLQTRLHLEMDERIKAYKGVVEDSTDKENKPIKIVKFPDGSTARMPRGLWVNYKMFDRP